MNCNRQVLRPTHNRLPLQDVSLQKYSSIDVKLTSTNHVYQQENLPLGGLTKKVSNSSRPILTALRSVKQQSLLKENENDCQMLVSPMGKTNLLPEEKLPPKTREQLEEELFELPDYRQSIFEHLKSVEQTYAPKSNFLEHQADINSPMRTILIDWLIEVTDEYKLNDDTLFLAVQYIDRFLSTVNVTRAKLQLLGTTCMYIAAKYEEMYPPGLEEFSFITDNTYETKHILRMEQIVIKMLNFSLSGPTPYTFLQYYLTHLKPSTDDNNDYKSLRMLANYLCTLTLLHDRPYSTYRSSMIAASCLILAMRLLHPQTNLDVLWTNEYVQLTSYTQSDLNQCLLALTELHLKSSYEEKISSSVLRRYLNTNKSHEEYEKRVRDIIHQMTDDDAEDDEDNILDLTLDEFDEENMSMDHPR